MIEPTHIACQACPVEWLVSTDDPDSTMGDALQHAAIRHPDRTPSLILRPVVHK